MSSQHLRLPDLVPAAGTTLISLPARRDADLLSWPMPLSRICCGCSRIFLGPSRPFVAMQRYDRSWGISGNPAHMAKPTLLTRSRRAAREYQPARGYLL